MFMKVKERVCERGERENVEGICGDEKGFGGDEQGDGDHPLRKPLVSSKLSLAFS